MLSKMQFLSEDRSFKSGKEGSRVLKRRKRFTPWLEEQINQGGIDGLEWIDKDIGLFKVPWVRVDKPDFVLETDAELFKRWAEHTGKYRRGDQPDPSTWKTRFRCALRKMREIVEVKELGRLEGNKPYRAFRFKPKLKERSAPLTCSANKVNTIESNNSTGVSVIDVPMDPWYFALDQLVDLSDLVDPVMPDDWDKYFPDDVRNYYCMSLSHDRATD